MPDITAFQAALRAARIDGWLLYDFRRSNAIAHRVLGLSPLAFFTRRWLYYVPASGEPVAIVSAVESHALAGLPGEQRVYRTWREYRDLLSEALAGARRVAMEYVPLNAIPYCSLVDAGTVEFVQSLGPEVVSSADFAQQFEAVLTPAQIESHRRAGQALVRAGERAFDWVRERLLADDPLTEYSIQRELTAYMRAEGLAVAEDELPLVSVNGNAANPHYSPTADRHAPARKGDLLLIDFSAPLAEAGAIFADYTWMAYLGERTSQRMADLFAIIARARDTGVMMLREAFDSGLRIEGWTVDDKVRAVIADAGYGDAFVHRTGHNIGERVHGAGAHLDNLETHDTRPLLANTCVSMEPGIYLPSEGLGLRTEVDVLLLPGGIEVTGWEQQAVKPLLA
ncbi:MAG TPA: M24 family metallopeptidase [Ktedonobacterales bacterium]|jgi:Xaa-Pro aminopeptidase|nr:M24 family metallopeptidase [Ktedonobacterales bacterium]